MGLAEGLSGISRGFHVFIRVACLQVSDRKLT